MCRLVRGLQARSLQARRSSSSSLVFSATGFYGLTIDHRMSRSRYGPVATAAAATKADARWTASTWKVVDKLNGDCLQKARQEGKTIVNIWAK